VNYTARNYFNIGT